MLDPKTELPNNHAYSFNPSGHINETPGTANFGARARKTAQNYENYRNWNGGGSIQFSRTGEEVIEEEDDDESGASSPPLWKNYRYLSPNSRSQAIARGQWELMEMVKTMPESCYELSLKDLVVQVPIRAEEGQQQDCLVDEKILGRNPRMGINRQESKKKNERKASFVGSRGRVEDGGLLLKMVLPFSLGSKKNKKKKNLATRVSPRPVEASSENKASKGGVEKEWWKMKKFSGSSESEGGGISRSSNRGSTGSSSSAGSSGSSSRSNSRRKNSNCSPGCWSFPSKKNKKTSK